MKNNTRFSAYGLTALAIAASLTLAACGGGGSGSAGSSGATGSATPASGTSTSTPTPASAPVPGTLATPQYPASSAQLAALTQINQYQQECGFPVLQENSILDQVAQNHAAYQAQNNLVPDTIIHRQNDDAYGVWRYIQGDHTEALKVKGALSSNDGDIVLRWALDGHGILIRSEWDLAKYVQSGRLKLVLPDTLLPSADLFVYYPSQRNQTARARAFIDFLIDHFQAPFVPVETGALIYAQKKRAGRKP